MPRFSAEKMRDSLQWAVSFAGVCFRNVSLQFANMRDVLSAQGSINRGGRFNFKGAFEVLYLSCDLHTCFEEATKSWQRPGFEVAMTLPCTVVGVEVKLSRVLDLTDGAVRRRLGITKANLIAPNWARTQRIDKLEAFTQQIGRLAREAGFEAILVPSAVTHGKNFDISLIVCCQDHL
ncbi:MAG: RES family NAD+ phosphorylase [bacterium]